MSKNEGLLDKRTVGGDHIYTEDHTPVLLNATLKTGHAKVESGSVLVFEADGTVDVIKTTNSLQIAGIAAEDVDDRLYVQYLAHGTVKANKLKGAGGVKFTDSVALARVNIYSI